MFNIPYIATYINDSPEPLIGEDKINVELANKFLKLHGRYSISAVDIHTFHTLVKVNGSGTWLSELRFEK